MLDAIDLNCLFPNKNTFVFSSVAELSIWNIKSQERKAQLCASECHTSFTCLSWKLKKKEFEVSSNKKKSSQKAKLIGLGTANGDILFIDENGQQIQKFIGGHTNQVNCLSWIGENTFYSCSDDKHIVEWNVKASSHKWKWKAHLTPVKCICVETRSKTLLSAGKVIKLWDLREKQLLMKFSGHSSIVSFLSYLNEPSSFDQTMSPVQNLSNTVFLSASFEENLVKVWKIERSKAKKRPHFSFSLPSPPRHINVVQPKTNDNKMQITVVTSNNQILFFSFVLNGSTKAPNPFKIIKFLTETASPLTILSAAFMKKSNTIIVAYGSSSKIAFRSVNLDEYADCNIVIYSKDPTQKRKSNREKVLSDQSEGITKKKQKKQSLSDKMDVDALSDKNAIEDNLFQDLFNKSSAALIPEVFEYMDENRIKNAIESIPHDELPSFLDNLIDKLDGKSTECLTSVRWLKVLLNVHPSILTQIKHPSDIWPLLDKLKYFRSEFSGVLPRLQGRLDLIMDQIVRRRNDETLDDDEFGCVFNEESSDEDEDYETFESFDDDELSTPNNHSKNASHEEEDTIEVDMLNDDNV